MRGGGGGRRGSTVHGHFSVHHDHCPLLLGLRFEVVFENVDADIGLRDGTVRENEHLSARA